MHMTLCPPHSAASGTLPCFHTLHHKTLHGVLTPQVDAAAAVCNLCLEFSSVKDTLLSHGAVSRLVAAVVEAGSEAGAMGGKAVPPALRVNAAWALCNLVYCSSTAVRSTLMQVRVLYCSLFV